MGPDGNFARAGLLDAIEKAIRNAFAKGDPRDRAFREKVYRSAFAVLEKALQANPNMTPAVAVRRREALSATISSIESEFLPAAPAVEPQPSAFSPIPAAVQQAPVPQPRQTPSPQQATLPPEPSFEPSLEGEERYPRRDSYEDAIDPPVYAEYQPRGSRRSWLTPLIMLFLVVVLGAGAWWALDSGLLRSPSTADAPAPPPQLTEGDTPPAGNARPPSIPGGSGDLSDWIPVFDPADPTTVTTPGDSRAEALTDDGQTFVRIHSGASGSPVLFDVGQGVLETLAGKRAVFNIVARTQEGQETQMSVECSLGNLGDCGRKRYAVGVTREEFLFEIDMPAAAPGSGGTIAINPDIEGNGRAVDIHAIRVTTIQ